MSGYLGFHHGWSDGSVSFALDDPDRFAFFCYDYAFNITTDGGRTFRNGRLKRKVRDWWGMYVGDMSPTWNKQPLVIDRKSTRLNSSHEWISRMPSSA